MKTLDWLVTKTLNRLLIELAYANIRWRRWVAYRDRSTLDEVERRR